MTKNINILNMLETVQNIFEATNSVISNMNDGDRIQLKELAQTVGMAVAMEPKHVLSFVNYFVHNSDIVYVTRGKNGGVVKGNKVSKIVITSDNPLVEPTNDFNE